MSLKHGSATQTFFIAFAISFRTSLVLSYDNVNYNNFDETQVYEKISFSFQNCFCVCACIISP